MLIKKAKAGDEKNIANVIINTWKYAYREIMPESVMMSLTPDRHEQLLRKNIKEQKETIFILENDDGETIGMVSGGKESSEAFDCEIVAIYVLPEYQKQGYGKQLFKSIIGYYKTCNYRSMIVWTFKENRDQKFYEKMGGTIQQTRSHTIAGKEIPLVGYVWKNINKIRT